MYLGEEGTEQFELTTRVNGVEIRRLKIHDPFHCTRVVMRGWKHAWNALTKGIEVQVSVNGSEGAQRAIMTLDPHALTQETRNILIERVEQRERNGDAGTVGYYVESSHA
jgi:hypothetical protein